MISANDIMNGNRLIAEFWGYKLQPADTGVAYWFRGYKEHYYIENHNHPTYGNKTHRILLSEIRFHKDWGWLMPVVEKIENIRDNGWRKYLVMIGDDWCAIETKSTPSERISTAFLSDKLLSTWAAVVEFVKWYNLEKMKATIATIS